jgi:hypothetical protein
MVIMNTRQQNTVIVVLIITLCAMALLWISNNTLKKELSMTDERLRVQVREVLDTERVAIRKDLDEKYKADIVSFQAMKKRLDIEKAKNARADAQ